MELQVIEPIKNYLKEFHSPEEFNVWYMKNKDEVDKLTTHKLNKMYKIDDYRITKIKGVLMLKKDRVKKCDEEQKDNSGDIEALYSEVKTLKEAYCELKNKLNQLIELVNKNMM